MHADSDLLALLALGEPVGTEEERVHLTSCPDCTAELAELRRIVALARDPQAPALVEPAPDVWTAIRAALPDATTRTPAEPRAYARLVPVLETWSRASAEAEMSTDDVGRRLLQVTLHADLPPSGVRQAWLVHRDDPARRQTLGVLDGPHGLWTVAHAIDVEQYAILEITQETVGSTGHSGQTIVRGELQPVA